MLQTTDIIHYDVHGFDGEKYIQLQVEAIKKRIEKFEGRLYLEIGGKFLFDQHASRVLPGFIPDSKKKIFSSLLDKADIIFCVNAKDLFKNRQLSSSDIDYSKYGITMMKKIENDLGVKPKISINRVTQMNAYLALDFKKELEYLGYECFLRYEIQNYPHDYEHILSEKGYGRDEYIPVKKDLVLVTGAASSSGKMSTCLGQMYQETVQGQNPGYGKYETFPIWNLPLEHPVNLAYEAATADIGDYNQIDSYHKAAYGEMSVNYNRDVEAFEIVQAIGNKFLPEGNFTRNYKSPTDMGINMAGFCITDEKVVNTASIEEIERRKNWYEEIAKRESSGEKAVKICEELLEKAKKYEKYL